MTRLAQHFDLDIDAMQHVPGPMALNHRIMINTHFVGPVQGEHCYKCPLSNMHTIDVRLPLPQAFTVSTCDMWVLFVDQINEYRHEAGFGNITQPEPSPEWEAIAVGLAHGWDAWGNTPQHAPNFPQQPAPQYAPQIHFGQPQDYVPRVEFQQLQQ